jgi:NADH:ubiquinone oxidoreductase subunit 6 (subunit J)
MESNIRRPPSVWIAQILLLICAILIALFFVVLLLSFPSAVQNGQIARIFIGYLISLGLLTIFCTGLWGLFKRKNYGRWLAIILISSVWVFTIFGQIFRTTGPMPYYEYKNENERLGGLLGTVLINGLFLLLLLRLALAKRIRAFFGQQTLEAEIDSQS